MMHKARLQLVAAQGKAGDKLRMCTYIEFQLVGEDGSPVPGEPYSITIPGGKVLTGELDSNGLVRIDGISAGTCELTFPKLDKEAWTPLPQTQSSTQSQS